MVMYVLYGSEWCYVVEIANNGLIKKQNYKQKIFFMGVRIMVLAS